VTMNATTVRRWRSLFCKSRIRRRLPIMGFPKYLLCVLGAASAAAELLHPGWPSPRLAPKERARTWGTLLCPVPTQAYFFAGG
jgi:hypothetical protein